MGAAQSRPQLAEQQPKEQRQKSSVATTAGPASLLKGALQSIKTKARSSRSTADNEEQHSNGHHQGDSPRDHHSSDGGGASKGSKGAGVPSAFVAWATRQSKQRQQSLTQFVAASISSSTTDAAAPSSACPSTVASLAPSSESAGVAPSSCSSSAHSTPLSSPVMTLDDVLAAVGASVPAAPLPPFQPHDGHALGAPKPHCHEARVAAANGIHALRATRDGEIESMLRLLCKIFEVETATVALLTGEAIFITGACGALSACICPDRWGFCGWSFLNSHHELLVVEDMDADARFAANFFVTDPAFSLKFYVAAPLISSNGHRLGTLCVMGQRASRFDAAKGQVLANLAEMLVTQLESKWVTALQAAGNTSGLLRASACYSSAYLVLDLSALPWRVLHMNEPAIQLTGVPWSACYDELPSFSAGRRAAAPFDGMPLDAVVAASGARLTWVNPAAWEFKLTRLTLANTSSNGSGDGATYSLLCRPAASDGLYEQQPFFVGIPSWLALSEANTFGRNYFLARLEREEPQQQQQPPFAGDSVEALTLTSTSSVAAAAACTTGSSNVATSSSDNSCPLAGLPLPPSPADGFLWLPRGVGPSPGDSSSSLSSSNSLGSFSMAGTSPPLKQPPSPAPSSASARRKQQQRSSLDSSRAAPGSSAASAVLSGCLSPMARVVPLPGLVVGPLLGRGSYGRVYRGLLKGTQVAVKIVDDVSSLRLSPWGEPLEISLTRDLRQTGIMATLGYAYSDAALSPPFSTSGRRSMGQAGGAGGGHRRTCWMLFEYMNKGMLVDAVIRGWFRTAATPLTGGAPNLRVVALTALEVAAAGEHLHAQGVLHGDLCGGNVMLTSCSSAAHGFTARVGDFGLVRVRTDSHVHPVEQRLAVNAYGTITHQPPEVLAEGGQAFTPAADVYAWGVLLWEMLTGSRAWAGMAAPAVVCQVAVLHRRLAIPPGLPPLLASLLDGALSPQPADRPTFAAIVAALTRFVQEGREGGWEQAQRTADEAHAAAIARMVAADAAAAAAAAVPASCRRA